MRRLIGVILLVGGVLLLVKAHDIGTSFASQLKEVFAGVPVDAAVKLYLAGTGLCVAGLLLIFWKKR
jgi:hypothetical protein